MTSAHTIVSGMRPTGPLHLGHYFGVLKNWTALQEEHHCYFFVADWHALTSEYASPQSIQPFALELVIDWISGGLDPNKCTFFQQSAVKEHAELNLILSMITPLGWLERNPTYKEVKQELVAKDLNTFGFLGYPVLMSADILMYQATMVPVGQDQLPHLELCREIARRFNGLYGHFFPEPRSQLTQAPKTPGLDGRKMSKSYGNSIFLKEDPAELKTKIMSMLTDTARQRLKDPGNPENCNLFPYLQLLDPSSDFQEIREGCTRAERGCVECKKLLLTQMDSFLESMRCIRRDLEKHPDTVRDVLKQGTERARRQAVLNMERIREMIAF